MEGSDHVDFYLIKTVALSSTTLKITNNSYQHVIMFYLNIHIKCEVEGGGVTGLAR